METLYPALVLLHGIAGTLALLTFWIAGFARKGSALHRGSGRIYLVGMIVVAATAVPMAVAFVLRGHPVTATFLGYLVVITTTSMWLGWRAIRMKRSQATFRNRGYALAGVLNLLIAFGVLTLGLVKGNPLLIGFSAVGGILGGGMLRRLWRPMSAGNWWLQEHYGAMLGCGAATHVAFLALGFDRVVRAAGWTLPAEFGLLAWALPVVVATVAGFMLDRRYRRPAGTPRAHATTAEAIAP